MEEKEFYLNKEKILEKLISFTEKETKKFIDENPALIFYAFAYDCNVDYGEINLCLNTLDSFERTLTHYQNGSFSERYQDYKSIAELKYNTGDWEHQSFATLYLFSSEELRPFNGFVPKTDELLALCNQALADFRSTDVYGNIKKEKEFISFCLDHDEDILEGVKKTNRTFKDI